VYSGIITEVGTVLERNSILSVRAPRTAGELHPGGSVSVNGACLSAVDVDGDVFTADVSVETARRSTLGEIVEGVQVNLELPLIVGDSIDGHLVQGHVDAVGKVTRVDEEGAGARVWIRPPKRFLDGIIAKSSVAVDGVSLTVAELLTDRFSVALIPVTQRDTALGRLLVGDRVNLEADLFVKTAGELHLNAKTAARRSLAALPWAGELHGATGVQRCIEQLVAGEAIVIYDPAREAEADIVYAGSRFRPESMTFLRTTACGHTTVPCDQSRLDRLEIPALAGAGDRHGTAYHLPVDLAAGTGTGVSAHDRAATIRRLARPEALPEDFLRPGHVFPLAGRHGGLRERRGHTEAALALCEAGELATVAVICEVMGGDGHMLSGAAVERFALRWALPMISIDELAAWL